MKTRTIITLTTALVLGLILAAGVAMAGPAKDTEVSSADLVSAKISYQGRLTDGSGNPLAGSHNLLFELWDAPSGGVKLWEQTTSGVQVQEGLFSAQLDVNPEHFAGQERWLAITVDGQLLSPRQEILPAPYALSLRPGAVIVGDSDSGLTSVTTGSYGVWGQSSNSSLGAGVFGLNSGGAGDGVQGVSEGRAGIAGFGNGPDSYGVYGLTTSPTGATTGVHGQSESDSGIGVRGYASAPSGQTVGVLGEAEADSGVGVVGLARAEVGETLGVIGISDSDLGTGVAGSAPLQGIVGYASGESGNTYGVRGESVSTEGHGGHFVNTNAVAWVDQVGLWAGSFINNVIEGHVVDELGTSEELVFEVDVNGYVWARSAYLSGGADFAEMLPAAEGVQAGDVLVIAADGTVERSSEAYQPTVIGVYSANPGFVGGSAGSLSDGQVPVAVVGVVSVRASAENGAIRPGDLLVASSTPGHAMKADPNPPIGTVIGKALQSLEGGGGFLTMLVMLQ